MSKDGSPIPDYARNQILASLEVSLFLLANGRKQEYMQSVTYATEVYSAFQDTAPPRLKFRMPAGARFPTPFHFIFANVARQMLIEPRAAGYELSLVRRSSLWRSLSPNVQRVLYPSIRRPLIAQCQTSNEPFDVLFPAPSRPRE